MWKILRNFTERQKLKELFVLVSLRATFGIKSFLVFLFDVQQSNKYLGSFFNRQHIDQCRGTTNN